MLKCWNVVKKSSEVVPVNLGQVRRGAPFRGGAVVCVASDSGSFSFHNFPVLKVLSLFVRVATPWKLLLAVITQDNYTSTWLDPAGMVGILPQPCSTPCSPAELRAASFLQARERRE